MSSALTSLTPLSLSHLYFICLFGSCVFEQLVIAEELWFLLAIALLNWRISDVDQILDIRTVFKNIEQVYD